MTFLISFNSLYSGTLRTEFWLCGENLIFPSTNHISSPNLFGVLPLHQTTTTRTLHPREEGRACTMLRSRTVIPTAGCCAERRYSVWFGELGTERNSFVSVVASLASTASESTWMFKRRKATPNMLQVLPFAQWAFTACQISPANAQLKKVKSCILSVQMVNSSQLLETLLNYHPSKPLAVRQVVRFSQSSRTTSLNASIFFCN